MNGRHSTSRFEIFFKNILTCSCKYVKLMEEGGATINIYQKIKALCKEQKISVSTLEKEAGFSIGTISRWAKHAPSVDRVQAAAKILGVSVDELLK